MKSLLLAALQSIVRSLVGALDYEQIKILVSRVYHAQMTGEEKRAVVIQEAKTIGIVVSTALLNLAIETIVTNLRK
jgi:hypothetical protein